MSIPARWRTGRCCSTSTGRRPSRTCGRRSPRWCPTRRWPSRPPRGRSTGSSAPFVRRPSPWPPSGWWWARPPSCSRAWRSCGSPPRWAPTAGWSSPSAPSRGSCRCWGPRTAWPARRPARWWRSSWRRRSRRWRRSAWPGRPNPIRAWRWTSRSSVPACSSACWCSWSSRRPAPTGRCGRVPTVVRLGRRAGRGRSPTSAPGRPWCSGPAPPSNAARASTPSRRAPPSPPSRSPSPG